MNDNGGRRRRRSGNEPGKTRRSGGGDPWLLTIVAAICVVAAGWFLGQGLAHFLSTGSPSRATAQATPSPETPAPIAAPQTAAPVSTPASKPRAPVVPKSTHKPVVHVTSSPEATATPRPTVAPTASAPPTMPPTPRPATPKPQTPKPETPKPKTPTPKPEPTATRIAAKPVVPPAASGGSEIAAQTVRSYIDAIKRGDPSAAGNYLGNGSPDEDFIDANTRIVSVSSARNNDGSYRVRVTMQAAKGTYYETFVVSPVSDGGRILEKSTVRP